MRHLRSTERLSLRRSLCLSCGLLVAVSLGTGTMAAEWAQPNYNLGIPTAFSAVGQAQSGLVALTLNHDGACTVQASVAQAGNEVLTRQVGADTLATSYKLTGAVLGGTADQDWVGSAAFIDPGRSYAVSGGGPSEIVLHARGAAPSNRATDAGTYEASIILTVSW